MDLLQNLLERIKPADDYQWYVYTSDRPTSIKRASSMYTFVKDVEFGVRPSTDGKKIRLIFRATGENKVFTIDSDDYDVIIRRSKFAKKIPSMVKSAKA